MTQDFSELPVNLPLPEDDGAGDRLFIMKSTGEKIYLSFIYPIDT